MGGFSLQAVFLWRWRGHKGVCGGDEGYLGQVRSKLAQRGKKDLLGMDAAKSRRHRHVDGADVVARR